MPIDRARIAKLVGMLGSNNDNEVLASVRAIDKTLTASNMTWGDFAAFINGGARTIGPPPMPTTSSSRARPNTAAEREADGYRFMCESILTNRRHLKPREAQFVQEMYDEVSKLGGAFSMSPKQASWLNALHDEHGRG